MFGNNAFGALGVEQNQAGPSRKQIQGEEIDVDWLQLVKTNHDVNVRVSDRINLEGLPLECNLMAVSNKFGILVVGNNNDVRIHRLKDVHKLLEESPKDGSPVSQPIMTISLSGRPVWIRLAVDETKLVVTTVNPASAQVYRLSDLMAGNTTPSISVTNDFPEHVLDLLPNPAPPSASDTLCRHTAIVTGQGLALLDIEDGKLTAPIQGQLTCASWSAKGKQIVCGERSGKLVQYTPDGTAKAEILPPPELASEFYPTSVEWLENDLFLVSYKNSNGDDDEPLSIFIIHRTKEEVTYTEFFDPLNTMGLPSRSASHRAVTSLKAWGDQTRHLTFLLSGKSSEVAVMRGKPAPGKEAPAWESLILEETARGVMPTGKTGVSDDSSCIGLELDLTSTKTIKMGIVGGVEVPDLSPAPRLMAYSQEGFIISFDVRYPDAGPYPNMVTPQDPPSIPEGERNMEVSAPAAAPEPPKPAFGATPPAFGSSATATGGFGQPAFGKPAGSAGFGQSAFGQPSAPTSLSFGQPAAPKASSPFGQPAASATTSPFGQSSTPAFGQGGFGQKTETKSAFGSTTPASSPFGQKTETKSAFGSTPTTSSPFGAPASGSAFGKPAFGSTPSFGQTGFGQSSTPPASAPSPAFGASAFGTPSTPAKSSSAFGQQASTIPTTTPASAFGQTAFGQKPAASSSDSNPTFGQTSTPTAFGQSAFGQPSKPTAFGSSSTASAFGSVPSTGGFAGFGSSKSAASGFGGSAFGQTKPTESSGSSPFGSGGAVKSGSAFGSSSGFGQSAFGAKPSTPSSPVVKPAEPEPKKNDGAAPTPPVASTGGFGLGGLGSALDSSKSSTKNDGMDALFASSKSTIQETEGTSPPDSPVLGASKQVDSDDEAPPVPKPKQAAQTSSTTSSFIKPATAFGSSSAFGQQPSTSPTSTTPAKTSGTGTPNAFSKPVSTTSTSMASGFGSTGFGSSAFGKPSTPSASAFGKTTPTVGNISGGFGGFAAKSTSATGSGFAGFGEASKSAFGGSTGGSFASLLSGDKKDETSESAPISPADKVETVAVKEEPKDLDKPEGPRAPIGYDVPSTSTPQVAKPTESPRPTEAPEPAETPKKAEEEDVKPDVSALETPNPKSTTPPPPEQTTTTPPAAQDEEVEVEDRAGSSPEIVEHADSEEHEEDAEGDYDEEEEEDDEEEGVNYDEDGERYDDDGERYDDDGETYDEEGEYDEDGEHEESYEEDEEYNEDEEPYEGEAGSEEDEEEDQSEGKEEQPQETAVASPEPTSGSGSLFSRLGPPAQPPFLGRHAARTSSPLGTQPPQNAETSTPPGTPPSKPPVTAGRDESGSAPPPFFGFNKSAQEVKSSTPSFGFGLGKPPSQPASAFGQSNTPMQSPAPKQAEKPLFGFGLGKPPSQSQPQSPAQSQPQSQIASASTPFSLFNKPSPEPASTPPAPSPSLFAKAPQSTGPAFAPASAPAPATQTVNPPTPSKPDGKFAVPARTPVKESPLAQDDGSRQMASVMQRMITDLVSEIKTMKEALATHAEYHRGLEPKFNKVTLDDLDGHDELPFSSIEDIAKLIDQLSGEMGTRRQKDKNAELKVLELQSRMLKTDMKVKQVEKLVEAHDDATYAYHSRNQDLSPRQVNSRVQIRRRTQAVESKLDDLDRSVRRLGQGTVDTRPTIQSLQSSLREVETAIAEKQDLIEDLSMRVKSIRLSTPGSRRSMSYAPASRNCVGPGRGKISTLDIPIEISDDVSRLIDREDRKIVVKAKVAKLTRAPKGGVKIGDLTKVDISSYIREDEPAIKKEPDTDISTPSLDARVKAESSSIPPIDNKAQLPPSPSPFSLNLAPTTSQPAASPSFGGFTLSLDPGDVSSSHRQRSNPGSRAHHPAPRVNLGTGGGASPIADNAASPPPLSFFPPPGSSTSSGSGNAGGSGNSPKGFFSLSGFGQK